MGKIFKVIKPGLATSVQDLGRIGYQQYGVVASGAMDSFALQTGNLLVGNSRDAAALEAVIMGPELEMLQDTVLAICGADLSPTLDGEPVQMWKSFVAKKGQILTFGKPLTGRYAYIAIAGGIETSVVMGSMSTYVKAGIGGFEGRYIQKEDCIEAFESDLPHQRISGRGLAGGTIPDYHSRCQIRVVLGPDHQAFSKAVTEKFLSGTYHVTTQSDRMGYHLEGPALSHVNGADIISDAKLPGVIQVPANGQPIVLLADRQTTGGYARIASVLSVDLPLVAQKKPGEEIQFVQVSLEKAQEEYVKREHLFRKLSLAATLGFGV